MHFSQRAASLFVVSSEPQKTNEAPQNKTHTHASNSRNGRVARVTAFGLVAACED